MTSVFWWSELEMKLFDRAEIEGYIKSGASLYDLMLSLGSCAPFVQAAMVLKTDVTVNEIRSAIGFPEHPDTAKGGKFIWEDEA